MNGSYISAEPRAIEDMSADERHWYTAALVQMIAESETALARPLPACERTQVLAAYAVDKKLLAQALSMENRQ